MNIVEVWLGRAGSGKSMQILDEIVQLARIQPFGEPIWWVVPAAASFATERALLTRLPATVRVEVLTLPRLAQRAAQDLPEAFRTVTGAPLQPLNRLGQRLVMAQAYEACRADLAVLRREQPSLAYLDAILDAFTEMRAYQLPVAQFDANAYRRLRPTLAPEARHGWDTACTKLTDLSLLAQDFDQRLSAASRWDSAALLTRLEPYLATWATLRGAAVLFDGFSTWTPQEARFVARLAQHASRCVVAVPTDTTWQGVHALGAHNDSFAPQSVLLLRALDQYCGELGVRVQPTDLARAIPSRQTDAFGPLLYLEENLFHIGTLTPPPAVEQHIQVFAAQNPRAEVAGVAREIMRLVHHHGLPYEEIAIVAPRLDDYLPELRDQLDQLGVPYTTDDAPAFATHPLARLLTGMLEAADAGLGRETVSRLLKTEFPGLARADADWLDDYMQRYEVDGDGPFVQQEPWLFAQELAALEGAKRRMDGQDARADRLRRQWYQVFAPVLSALTAETLQPATLAACFWDLLQRVGAPTLLAQWIVNEDAALSPIEASLHEQAWELMVDLLEDFASFADISLPTATLLALLRGAVDEAVLTTIPGHVHHVLVTDAKRAEGWTCDTVFVLGASDGSFPVRVQPSGLWLDEERLCVGALYGRALGLTTEERQWCERYPAYRVFTRARTRLYLSYPLAASDGKAMRCASLVERVKRMFVDGGLREAMWTLDFVLAGASPEVALWNGDAALTFIGRTWAASQHRPEADRLLPALVHWLSQDPRMAARLDQVRRGQRQQALASPLPGPLATRLFRGPSTVNVSQLELFAACPFEHYVRYGLRVHADTGQSRLPAARGTLVHTLLDTFVRNVMDDLPRWRDMADGAVVQLMRSVFRSALDSPQQMAWQRRATRRRLAQGVLRVVEQAALVLTEHVRHGTFTPRLVEFTVDEELASATPAAGPLSNAAPLRLRGRIDRIDVVDSPNRHAFRIVDYKSSQRNLDWTRVRHGLQLQLPVYAAIVQRMAPALFGRPSEVAGIVYLPVVRRVAKVPVPTDAGHALQTALARMRARGVLTADVELIGWMDDRLPFGDQTPLFPKVFKQDGAYVKGAPTMPQQGLQAMFQSVLTQVRTIAQDIAAGTIAIRPYRLGRETPCERCAFRPICHIDPRHDTTPFRRLPIQVPTSDWLSSTANTEGES